MAEPWYDIGYNNHRNRQNFGERQYGRFDYQYLYRHSQRQDSAASNSPQQIPVTLIVTAPESSGAVSNWDPNTESNMAGYKVYVGTASGVYGPAVNVGNVTTFKVINLSKGKTYYFAITAYDTSGNESAYSNEATKTIN